MMRFVPALLQTIGAFAVAAALGGLVLYAILASDSRSDTTVNKALVSPDGAYTATLYTSMGGGAAGWCSMKIAVNPRDTPFDAAADSEIQYRFLVYDGRCAPTPKMQWQSPALLAVALPGFVGEEWARASVKGKDDSGNVTINFDFGQAPLPSAPRRTPPTAASTH